MIGSWREHLCEDLQSWWWFQMISSFHTDFCKDQIILVVPDDFFLSGRFVWRSGNTDGSRWCFPFRELSVKSRYYCSLVVPFRELSVKSLYYCSIVVPFREISLKSRYYCYIVVPFREISLKSRYYCYIVVPFRELSLKSRYHCYILVPFRELSVKSMYYCSIVVPFREISLKTKEKWWFQTWLSKILLVIIKNNSCKLLFSDWVKLALLCKQLVTKKYIYIHFIKQNLK